MKSITNKLTIPLLAAVLIAALSCVIQIAHADSQLVSAASGDNEVNLQEGPPLSVAFHSNSVGNTEVYVMDPNGKNQTRLTFDPRTNQQPDISPNGQQIVYCGNPFTDTNPEGDLEIMIMDAEGSSVKQLTFNGAGISDCWPRWSPKREANCVSL